MFFKVQAGRTAETGAENNSWLNCFSSQGEAINMENLPERKHLPETDFAFTFGFYFGTARV